MPTKSKFLLVELYHTNKLYCVGVVCFFAAFLILPLRNNSSLFPLFRNWDMYQSPANVRPVYENLNMVVNDSINFRKLYLSNAKANVILGQLHAYLNVRKYGNEGSYVFESNFLRRMFPHYEVLQHRPASDTLIFKKFFLSNMSKCFGVPVHKVQVFQESIVYDLNGYAHLKDSTLITTF